MTHICHLLMMLLVCAGPQVQKPSDQEQIWKDFITWFRTAPLGPNPVGAYLVELQNKGPSQEDIQRQTAIIMRLFGERPEGVEIHFDRVYARPLSGNPARDGFNSLPSAFLVEVTRELKPGTALDAGMGQGRNALFLAKNGWEVTGFDISETGLAAARSSAEKSGLHITTVKASYDAFDFGSEKWDLIVLAFAWAPVSEPEFVRRLNVSLRKGGKIVFEHFIRDPQHPHPEAVRALEPGRLRDFFSGFQIERYEETEGTGDWGGPGARLVRMVARKQ